jgi:hypothetical protein
MNATTLHQHPALDLGGSEGRSSDASGARLKEGGAGRADLPSARLSAAGLSDAGLSDAGLGRPSTPSDSALDRISETQCTSVLAAPDSTRLAARDSALASMDRVGSGTRAALRRSDVSSSAREAVAADSVAADSDRDARVCAAARVPLVREGDRHVQSGRSLYDAARAKVPIKVRLRGGRMPSWSPATVVLATVCTLGLFGLYWQYATSRGLRRATGERGIRPGLEVLLTLLTAGLGSIYVLTRNARIVHGATMYFERGHRDGAPVTLQLMLAAPLTLGVAALVAVAKLQRQYNEFSHLAARRERSRIATA